MLLTTMALVALGAEPVQERMEVHWDLTAGLQTELVRGNLPVVRSIATRLAELPFDGMPAGLLPRLEVMRTEARTLSTAVGVDDATFAAARLGASCAACHVARDSGPQIRPRAFPPAGGDDRQDMVDHQAAADWLWLGLVAPSSSAWDRGARDLAHAAPTDELRHAAKTAVGADPAARVDAYVAIVRSCSSCHLEENLR
jgi:mono/diheme cytochrome c family protein